MSFLIAECFKELYCTETQLEKSQNQSVKIDDLQDNRVKCALNVINNLDIKCSDSLKLDNDEDGFLKKIGNRINTEFKIKEEKVLLKNETFKQKSCKLM